MSNSQSNISSITDSSLDKSTVGELNSVNNTGRQLKFESAVESKIPYIVTPNKTYNRNENQVSPITPLVEVPGDFVRHPGEEGYPIPDPAEEKKMEDVLRELKKQQRIDSIEKRELQRQQVVINLLITYVNAGQYDEIDNFFNNPINKEFECYKPVISDLINTREQQLINRQEQEKKIIEQSTANKNKKKSRSVSSKRVRKKGVTRGGKKSKSKKNKRLVKTKRKR